MAVEAAAWQTQNQRYLTAAVAEVRLLLERHAALRDAGSMQEGGVQPAEDGAATPSERLDPPPALETLCQALGLSRFERAILLCCAGVELESRFASTLARAHGDPVRTSPTFSLALSTLPDPHWSAIVPGAPLRRWRLVELAEGRHATLLDTPLRVDERVLHFLAGIPYLDERLAGLFLPVAGDILVPSHRAVADRLARAWSEPAEVPPVLQLCGADDGARRAIAAAASARLGLRLYAIAADHLPPAAAEMESLARLWEREAALLPGALLLDADSADGDARAPAVIGHFLDRVGGPVVLSTRERWKSVRREVLTFDVEPPAPLEQRQLWVTLLGEHAATLDGRLDALASQFRLGAPAIRAAAHEATDGSRDPDRLAARLWDATRAQARPRLEGLAQRIEASATWSDLVLPDSDIAVLREIEAQVAHRATVYELWRFAEQGSRGLGITAMFAGASGTGKTLAAEVLANALRLDLYRIDLSSVVSKYIGETEKNLRRVFDAAEQGGAILFFDEADALFGKRSDVKDSHDRYANIEINYLLQRMESYRGLAVLATNLKGALDSAFLRRIRFVVNFPFPDPPLREQIWRRVFPKAAPLAGLDYQRLAQLNVTGGSIRNIALHAAFLAAEAGSQVSMAHLAHAARREYAKLDKPLAGAELQGWEG